MQRDHVADSKSKSAARQCPCDELDLLLERAEGRLGAACAVDDGGPGSIRFAQLGEEEVEDRDVWDLLVRVGALEHGDLL